MTLIPRRRNTTAHQRLLSLHRLAAVLLAGATALAAVPGLASPPNIPRAEAMRAKVEKLGVGEHVMVKLAEGPKLHGHIVGIDPQAFQLKPDNAQAAIVIPYDHVLKVKKNPGAITWMLIGAALVIIIIVATTR